MNTPFTIERVYNAPAEKVWEALTSKEKMKKWCFDVTGFKPEVGYEFQFEGKKPGREEAYVHLCRVTNVIPGKKLSYSWQYKGFVGITLVTFEIFPEGNQTRLKLTHEGLENFIPNNNPDFDAKNFAQGWGEIVGTLLKEFVEQ
ncbi:MAG: SRPBCC family protein [Bacteroidia bacterium]